MRIRKNGKVISLTESDLMRITRKVLREQDETKTPKFSLMNLGLDGNVLERVLSTISQDWSPKTDKSGTYIFLSPSDFRTEGFISEKLGGKMGKEYMKIFNALVSAGLLAADPSEKTSGGVMFGPKGKGNFQIYFKKPERSDVTETRNRRYRK